MRVRLHTLVLGLGLPIRIAAGQAAASTIPAADDSIRIGQVEALQSAFNPSEGEEASVRFTLSRPGRATLTIWGPNQELIARPLDGQERPAGLQTATWDGRDVEGDIVPDEAYFFTLEAVSQGAGDRWDPLLSSGGERVVAGELQQLDETHFAYSVPKPSRVLVRAAVPEGPLVLTMVNWEPRPAGFAVETWDGRDADRLRRAAEIRGLRFGVMAFSLPDKSVIAKGNPGLEYRRYFEEKAKSRPRKQKVVRTEAEGVIISPHALLPPHLNRDPRLTLEFDGQSVEPATRPADAPPPVRLTGDSALFRVDVPDRFEREFMNNQKFELIIFVDDQRVLEVEQAHVPFNYPWDLRGLAPGRHILTVNVSSFRNHVGTVSRFVDIVQ